MHVTRVEDIWFITKIWATSLSLGARGFAFRLRATAWRNRKLRARNKPTVPTSLVAPRMQDGVRSTSRRCGGGFAKQVARNVEKGEAPTLLRERLEICLDENLDGLIAGINLDTDRSVAKVNLVASPVFSSNDSVGHSRSAPRDRRRIRPPLSVHPKRTV